MSSYGDFVYNRHTQDQGYVYYDWIGQTYPTLAGILEKQLKEYEVQLPKATKAYEHLIILADAEEKKEIYALEKFFGYHRGAALHNSSDLTTNTKTLINAINTRLNLKKVYERNRQILLNAAKSEKDKRSGHVYDYFAGYFRAFWDGGKLKSTKNDEKFDPGTAKGRNKYLCFEAIKKALVDGQEDRIESIIEQYLTKTVDEALNWMFSGEGAGLERSDIDPKLIDAYRTLLPYLGSYGDKNSIAYRIGSLYNVDDLKKSILDSIQYVSSTSKLTQANVRKGFSYTATGINQKKGFVQEMLVTAGGKRMARIFNKTKSGNRVEAINMGMSKFTDTKADEVFAIFNAELDINIEDKLNAFRDKANYNDQNHRTVNRDIMMELDKALKDVDDGILIYVSDKNYLTSYRGRSFEGYHAGKPYSLKQYYDLMQKDQLLFENNLTQFCAGVAQLTEGAIFSHSQQLKSYYESLIAQNVAYLLFDDFTTIGDTIAAEAKGAKAIHLMNLGGIYIPLSVILRLLAESIKEAEGDSYHGKEIVNVSIKTTKVLWTKENYAAVKYSDKYNGDSARMWNEQREDTWNKTTIAVKFLKNINQIIKDYT